MSLSVKGVIHAKFHTQNVTASYSKRDFVLIVTDNPQYPQYISFQLSQEKCALLDNFMAGAEVEVSFNLRGRQWVSPQNETKYFNTLEAWKIVLAANQNQEGVQEQQDSTVVEQMDDELPF